jgi:hypothetical protein
VPASKYVDPSQRAKVLFVRVSEATHKEVAAAAGAAGVGPGDYLRALIMDEMDREHGR